MSYHIRSYRGSAITAPYYLASDISPLHPPRWLEPSQAWLVPALYSLPFQSSHCASVSQNAGTHLLVNGCIYREPG